MLKHSLSYLPGSQQINAPANREGRVSLRFPGCVRQIGRRHEADRLNLVEFLALRFARLLPSLRFYFPAANPRPTTWA